MGPSVSVSRPFTRFLLGTLAVIALLGLCAWVLLGEIIGPHARPLALWSSGVVLFGALCGRAAGLLAPPGRPESPAVAALAGLGARLLSTSALCFVLLQAGIAPAQPFVVTLGVQYLALLVLEVRQAVAEVRASPATPRTPEHDERGAGG